MGSDNRDYEERFDAGNAAEDIYEGDGPGKGRLAIAAAVLVIAALLSVFASGYMSSPDTYDKTIGKLDDKKATVAKMAAGVTATSVAISAVPSDVGTPIAQELADLSGYFVFIYSAIYIEKYLTTTSGLISFRFLIPIALLLLLLSLFWTGGAMGKLRMLGRNLLIFSLVLWLVVPFSVMISNHIESTFEASINETLEQGEAAREEAAKEKEDKNAVEKFVDGVKEKTTGLSEKFQNFLNNMLDAIAVMIVTACVIPICVLLFMLWVVKMLFGFNLRLPSPRGKGKKLYGKVRSSFDERDD